MVLAPIGEGSLLLIDPLFGSLSFLLALAIAAVGIGGLHYHRRRNEKKRVYRLLAFLRDHRVLYGPLYQEEPVAASESVRGMQMRLRNDFERLPRGSKAFRPVLEMHEACLRFLTQVTSLPMPGETELLPGEWTARGVHRQTLEDALTKLRRVFASRMDQLYESYSIEKPPPCEADETK
jgi:hypothetical protein